MRWLPLLAVLLATLVLTSSLSSRRLSALMLPNGGHAAMDAEMSGLDQLSSSAFTWVLLSDAPAGVCILSCKWVYKIKPEKYKTRIGVHGNQQDLDETVATYSPTLKSITLHLLLALASY